MLADPYGRPTGSTAAELATDSFFHAVEAWLSDGYYLDQRIIARSNGEPNHIWAASVALFPLKPPNDYTVSVRADGLIVEQIQKQLEHKHEAVQILRDAAAGTLRFGSGDSVAFEKGTRTVTSENGRDQWFFQPHLSVQSFPYINDFSVQELALLDNKLRLAEPPFDGLNDVAGWFGLNLPVNSKGSPYIDLRVSPPVDISFLELSDDKLKIELKAVPSFDPSGVRLALRVVPGIGVARMQVADRLKWTGVEGFLQAVAEIDVVNADAVLVVLMIGPAMVRRQFVSDPAKARNQRLLTFRTFDPNLKQMRKALLEEDGRKFETGVAALLFTRGFTSVQPLETDAPDIVVTTTSGRLVLIECTIKVSDVSAKIGKLVDRRAELETALKRSGHVTTVIAMLVCRQPKANLDANIDAFAKSNRVLVAAQENIQWLLDNEAKFPLDPDGAFDEALQLIAASNTMKPDWTNNEHQV
ncbi:hypothetical protein PPGU19_047970 [Paraburkholderia sp. PGU19]|uniref:hypothetical protein n=1 Tax=Paraburkholderia sp. PGU19 TaxID=2735434 RepID=UPI0015D98E33|nr:hypothetical protein [Paraburkholderia sp. PGU19]BCG00229.1 hypothetical protein PPGU19_047970 [Paraburkholderia sp. PGU19]